ncbi:MAG: hypothetical protein KAJ51_13140 [Thermoplasmata archaeon]|nr:hypothetical protein [Thermoplasmata archaeon]
MIDTNKNSNSDKIIIDYILDGERCKISYLDFEKVNDYCENECMGIKFLMNANFLKKLVKSLLFADFSPPFTLGDFKSEKFRKFLIDNGMLESMRKQYGTDDIELVTKLIIKSTYDFLKAEN